MKSEDPEVDPMIARCVKEKKTLMATFTDYALSLADVVVVDVQCNYQKEKVGSICLAFREKNRECAEVMYWLAPRGRGRGIATNAVRMLCQWAFHSLGLERVILKTLIGNTRSQLVAERVGFQKHEVKSEDSADANCLWFELIKGG